EEAFDTETGRAVWWDGLGWSYTHPVQQNGGRHVSDELLPLAPQPRPARLPLSFTQQRLWFVNQLQKNTPEYNMPAAFRLRGDLDISALQRAIAHIVDRHEVLRTTFSETDGEPLQVIAPRLSIDLPVSDLSGLDDEAREKSLRAAIREEH